MPFSTYSELKSSIADWAARSDFASVIPDFISLAEALFNQGDEELAIDPLRVRDMETRASLTITNGEADLPEGFLEAVRVTRQDNGQALTFATPEWMAQAYPTGDSGYPKFYTVIAGKLVVSTDVDLVYYAEVPNLSDDAPTNWLLAKQPSVYLWGALYFLSVYAKDLERAPVFLDRMSGALKGLQQTNRTAKAGLFVRSANGPTP
jgi:hypothetical protein